MVETNSPPVVEPAACAGSCVEARLSRWREAAVARWAPACHECLRLARRLALMGPGQRDLLERLDLLPPPAFVPCCGAERPCDCRGPR